MPTAQNPAEEYCTVCNFPIQKGRACSNCLGITENQRLKDLKVKSQEIDRLGGLRAYTHFTFANIRQTPINSTAIAALRDFQSSKANILLHGPTGAGKTHMATAAMRKSGMVIKAVALVADVRNETLGNRFRFGMKFFETTPNIVIDDLGVGRDTEFSISSILEIVDGRWMSMIGGLIVTSNLSPEELASKFGDDRIVSRLVGMCRVFDLTGEPDYRISK